MNTTNKSTKISTTGYNKKEGQYYAVFSYEKKEYMITWRPKTVDEGVTFDVGILPVQEENDGLSKRATRETKSNETSTRTPKKKGVRAS